MTDEEKFNKEFYDYMLRFAPYDKCIQMIIKNRKIHSKEDIDLFLKDFNITGTKTGNKIFKVMMKYVG